MDDVFDENRDDALDSCLFELFSGLRGQGDTRGGLWLRRPVGGHDFYPMANPDNRSHPDSLTKYPPAIPFVGVDHVAEKRRSSAAISRSNSLCFASHSLTSNLANLPQVAVVVCVGGGSGSAGGQRTSFRQMLTVLTFSLDDNNSAERHSQ